MSFKIGRLASLSGFDPGVLRAWERRFGLLSPERTESGYRLYQTDDLLVLSRVRELLDDGQTIGDVARVGRAQLLQEAKAGREARETAETQHAAGASPHESSQSLPWQVLDALPCAVIVTDARGHVTWVNRGVLALCGYDLAEMHGRTPGSVLQGPDTDPGAIDKLREAVAERRPCSVAILNYDKQGRPYRALVEVAPLGVADAHRGFVGIARQIDEDGRLVGLSQ